MRLQRQKVYYDNRAETIREYKRKYIVYRLEKNTQYGQTE